MPYGFGYYSDYTDDYNVSPSYSGRSYNSGYNYSYPLWGAALAPIFGISPLLGFGFGALLGNSGGENTNIININTGRRYRGC